MGDGSLSGCVPSSGGTAGGVGSGGSVFFSRSATGCGLSGGVETTTTNAKIAANHATAISARVILKAVHSMAGLLFRIEGVAQACGIGKPQPPQNRSRASWPATLGAKQP